jgi:L-alanine-DL-glutamate epimerase-like enolase superfamily enzyme
VLRDDGTLALPQRDGLGIDLDREALAAFGEAAARLAR